MVCKYFLSFLHIIFSLSIAYFTLQKFFVLMQSHFFIFALLHVPLMSHSRPILRAFSSCFFLGALQFQILHLNIQLILRVYLYMVKDKDPISLIFCSLATSYIFQKMYFGGGWVLSLEYFTQFCFLITDYYLLFFIIDVHFNLVSYKCFHYIFFRENHVM